MQITNDLTLVDEVFKWNTIAENTNYNRHLEASMAIEEFSELIIALKNKDKQEILDAFADINWVVIGTMMKFWITKEEIHKTLLSVRNSNFSKFIDMWDWTYTVLRDDTGKILKPDSFKEPDFSFLQ